MREECATHVFACDETTSERSIRYDRDTELASGLQQTDLLVLDVQGEGRILDLDGSDRVDGMCAPKSRCGDL